MTSLCAGRGTTRSIMVVLAVLCAAPSTHAHQASTSDEADRAYRTGLGLVHREMHDLAVPELRSFLRAHPNDPRVPSARYALAVCLWKAGDADGAARELDRVTGVKGFELAGDARLLRAQCAMRSGDVQRAVAETDAIRSELPTFERRHEAEIMRGEALMKLGKSADAKAALAGAIMSIPKGAQIDRAELLLAMCEVSLGDDAGAAARLEAWRRRASASAYAAQGALLEAQCRERLGDVARAEELYVTAAKAAEAAVAREAMLGRARLARERGDVDAASAALAALGAERASEPGVAIERGRLLLSQRQPDAALEVLRAAFSGEVVTGRDEVRYWIAMAELERGRCAEAAAQWNELVKELPDSRFAASARLNEAIALSRCGEDERAYRQLAAWRAAFPKHELVSEAVVAQASCALRLGKHGEALALCETAAGMPKSSPARLAQIGLLAAESLYGLERYRESADRFEAALRELPEQARTPSARVRRGLALVKAGRAEEGINELTTAISLLSASDAALGRTARLSLGEVFFSRSDWSGAERWLAEAAAKDAADDPDVLIRLALSIQRQGRGQEALAWFDRVLRASPHATVAASAHALRAQTLEELDRREEAAREWRAIIELERQAKDQPLTEQATRRLARLAADSGRLDEAVRDLSSLGTALSGDVLLERGMLLTSVGKYREAVEDLEQFLASAPTHARRSEGVAYHGIALHRAGRAKEAAPLLERSAADEKLGVSIRAMVEYERGRMMMAGGNSEEAAKAFARARDLDPMSELALHAAVEQAQLLASAQKHEQALASLDAVQTVIQRPETGGSLRARALYLRGRAQLMLDRPGEATTTLQEADQAQGDVPLKNAIGCALGEALLRVGRAREAMSMLARVVAAEPERDVLAAALLKLGEAAGAAEAWEQSEEAYARFLSTFGESELWFHAEFGRAWAQERQSRFDAAMTSYARVVARHSGPSAARAQFQIGECLYALKRYDEAARELVKVDVLYAYPQWSAAALYEAGRCFLELGKPAEAARLFEDVMNRFKDTEWSRSAAEKRAAIKPAPLPGQAAEPSGSVRSSKE